MTKTEFWLNGKLVNVVFEDTDSLLKVLREGLGLTGAKEGCGQGDCGACTVLVNDAPVNACLFPAVQLSGRRVLTVEGLSQNKNGSFLQQAFLKCGAVQCGFCTPGMLMSAHALLLRNPDPSEEEIRLALSGNLCRCTGYEPIIEAVRMAAANYQTVQDKEIK